MHAPQTPAMLAGVTMMDEKRKLKMLSRHLRVIHGQVPEKLQ